MGLLGRAIGKIIDHVGHVVTGIDPPTPEKPERNVLVEIFDSDQLDGGQGAEDADSGTGNPE